MYSLVERASQCKLFCQAFVIGNKIKQAIQVEMQLTYITPTNI